MTMDLNLAQTAEALSSPNQQLNLPTGPFTVVRPRRERTDEDREWYSKQLAVPHEKRIDKLVFERMAFYGSLNPERTAFPSVKRLADEAMCSPRSAQYALRRLETAGLIECLDDASGRTTARGGRTTARYCVAGVQTVHPSGANRAPNVLREGKKRSTKSNPRNDTAQTIDPSEGKEVNPLIFPSPSKNKEKAKTPHEIQTNAPKTQGVTQRASFAFPKVIALWYALMRKLGRECNDTMASQLDQLPHAGKKRIIDDLEAEERELAHKGKVEPAPIQKPKGFQSAAAQEAQRVAACAHEPADDLPVACRKCGGYIGKE